MKNIFITNLEIENVRHLRDIVIPLSTNRIKHLIFTGKNGSGKTSVLCAMANYLNAVATTDRLEKAEKFLKQNQDKLQKLREQSVENNELLETEKKVLNYTTELRKIKQGIELDFNESKETLHYHFEKGNFVLAYYKAERTFYADVPKHVEKIDLKDKYLINESPRHLFVKYLLDLKVTEALARNNGKNEKANEINAWFKKLQKLLRNIFDDDSLELIFEEDSYTFLIKMRNREPFDFNSLSSGFAAVLDIVLDIIVRMEKVTNRSFDFNVPGIVLIDEIETHLHLDMQKTILGFLIAVFPNIQFIVSTHSPFILNSIDNVVIYDLENNTKVEDGLINVPYEGIVKGYFEADVMSDSLREKYERYRVLVTKEELTDDDFEEIAELEMFLNEIPDYLALDITTEYQRLKIQFESREDI